MPNKVSDEARIANYFDTANLDKAEVMLELAKAAVKRRRKVKDSGSMHKIPPAKTLEPVQN